MSSGRRVDIYSLPCLVTTDDTGKVTGFNDSGKYVKRQETLADIFVWVLIVIGFIAAVLSAIGLTNLYRSRRKTSSSNTPSTPKTVSLSIGSPAPPQPTVAGVGYKAPNNSVL